MDYMGPYIRRQQRIGAARMAFDLFVRGRISLEDGAAELGVPPAQFREGAQTWVDGGRKDSDLDAFLSRFSLLTGSSTAGTSTSI